MIPASAKKAFLDRQLDSFDWIKQASVDELDEALYKLNPRPNFHTEPFLHQKACFILGLYVPEFLYLLDMGTGKTKIVLDLIDYQIMRGDIKRALVLVPNVINIEGFSLECKKHRPSLELSALTGSSHERECALMDDAHIYIINYAGLVALTTLLRPSGRGKRKREIQWGTVEMLARRFNAVVFDESDALRNHRSLTYKICNKLGKSCSVKYALTGTPFGRDPMDLWSQFHAIDGGETLGKTLGIFRECFFSSHVNFWGGYEYTFDKRKEKKLHQVLKHRSIRYKDTECDDLPKKVYTDVFVSFPVDIQAYYKRVVDKVVKAKGNYQLMQNAFIRMRQLSSGFLRHVDDRGRKIDIQFDDNPKLDALLQLIDQMPVASKMVVYHEFTHTGKIISNALNELKIGHVRLWSGTKDKAQALNEFLNSIKCRILDANHQSGSKGLNLQVANYIVFFESPVSPITRKQCEKRCDRSGQESSHVFIFDLMMKGSMDEKIRRYLKEGENLFKALIEGNEEWT